MCHQNGAENLISLKKVTQFESLRTVVTKQHYFTNSSHSAVGWLLLLISDLFLPHLFLKGTNIFRIQMCDFT
jgi:hypothetical protein